MLTTRAIATRLPVARHRSTSSKISFTARSPPRASRARQPNGLPRSRQHTAGRRPFPAPAVRTRASPSGGSPTPRDGRPGGGSPICSASTSGSPDPIPSERITTMAPRAMPRTPHWSLDPAEALADHVPAGPVLHLPRGTGPPPRSGSRELRTQVTRVSRVPSANASTRCRPATAGLQRAAQRRGVGLHRAGDVEQQRRAAAGASPGFAVAGADGLAPARGRRWTVRRRSGRPCRGRRPAFGLDPSGGTGGGEPREPEVGHQALCLVGVRRGSSAATSCGGGSPTAEKRSVIVGSSVPASAALALLVVAVLRRSSAQRGGRRTSSGGGSAPGWRSSQKTANAPGCEEGQVLGTPHERRAGGPVDGVAVAGGTRLSPRRRSGRCRSGPTGRRRAAPGRRRPPAPRRPHPPARLPGALVTAVRATGSEGSVGSVWSVGSTSGRWSLGRGHARRPA